MTQDDKKSYDPSIRTLAYAMQNMSHAELCAAIVDIDDKAHKVGFKNGKFASKAHYEKALNLAVIEAKISELDKAMSGYSWIEWRRLKELRLSDGTKTPLQYIENRFTELKKQQQALTGGGSK